jgi:hypothetical protein
MAKRWRSLPFIPIFERSADPIRLRNATFQCSIAKINVLTF